MVVEFKLKSYVEQANTPEEKYTFAKSRNRYGYYPTTANFVYDKNTKIIYDSISCEKYREVRHENILLNNGFKLKIVEPDNIEPEYLIRFEFTTTGCYNQKGQYLGEHYRYNELGISGLQFSGLFYDIPKYQKRADSLKSYDLDIIESYIEYLKKEQEQIRASEINLNLPQTPDNRGQRRKIISSSSDNN